MTFARSRTLGRIGAALIALTAAQTAERAEAVPLPVLTSTTYSFVRTAGTCPKNVTIVTHAQPYEGGAKFVTTARTSSIAPAPRVVSATQHRVVFGASRLARPYAACEATARFVDAGSTYAFTLHAGTMRFVFVSSPELQEIHAGAAAGNPVITSAVAD